MSDPEEVAEEVIAACRTALAACGECGAVERAHPAKDGHRWRANYTVAEGAMLLRRMTEAQEAAVEAKRVVLEEDRAKAANSLKASLNETDGLTRAERIANLMKLARDERQAPAGRVAAEQLIARYQGWLDNPPEEAEGEREAKWEAMHKEALERIGSAEALIAEEMRKPEVRGEVERMLKEAEA